MIPYHPQPVWHLGDVTISAFGIAAAAALLAGYSIALWRARALRLDEAVCSRCFVVFAIGGLSAGHFVSLWPIPANMARIWEWAEIWQGQSANGLAAGALVITLAAYFALRRRGLDPWGYLNTLAFAFPFAWTLARLGCALAHDHIGKATNSVFGIRFPSGTRFDLGLLECLASAVLAACFYSLRRVRANLFLPALLASAVVVRAAIRNLVTGI